MTIAFVAFVTSLAWTLTLLSLPSCMSPKKKDKDKGTKRERAPPGDGLDVKAADRMRSWLRRRRDPGHSDHDKAAAALGVLENLHTPSQRKKFLVSFEQDKEKKLDWVKTFKEECENVEEHTAASSKGYQTVPEFLKKKGLSMADFSKHDDAWTYVKKLWSKNAEEFKTAEKYPPILGEHVFEHEYYFVHQEMESDSLITRDSKKYEATSELGKKKAWKMPWVSWLWATVMLLRAESKSSWRTLCGRRF